MSNGKPNDTWGGAERTLHAKVVYYGPTLGGKTTNLETLHRITSIGKDYDLLTVRTENDRTLFFDLLPVELGSLRGIPVVLSLYAVPGKVRFEATRRVVLGGADAVVFVADSQTSRRDQNVWSMQDCRSWCSATRRTQPAPLPWKWSPSG